MNERGDTIHKAILKIGLLLIALFIVISVPLTTSKHVKFVVNPITKHTNQNQKISSAILPYDKMQRIVKEKQEEEKRQEELRLKAEQELKKQREAAKLKEDKQNEFAEKTSSLNKSDRLNCILQYKALINEYSEWVSVPSIHDAFSKNDLRLMQKCIETEVFEREFNERTNVASVIINRYNSSLFPNQIDQIIVKGQFAFGRENIIDSDLLAIEYVFYFGDTTNGALFFHSNAKTDTFCDAHYIFSDKVHHFYKY